MKKGISDVQKRLRAALRAEGFNSLGMAGHSTAIYLDVWAKGLKSVRLPVIVYVARDSADVCIRVGKKDYASKGADGPDIPKVVKAISRSFNKVVNDSVARLLPGSRGGVQASGQDVEKARVQGMIDGLKRALILHRAQGGPALEKALRAEIAAIKKGKG